MTPTYNGEFLEIFRSSVLSRPNKQLQLRPYRSRRSNHILSLWPKEPHASIPIYACLMQHSNPLNKFPIPRIS